jgi:hypothetical protein
MCDEVKSQSRRRIGKAVEGKTMSLTAYRPREPLPKRSSQPGERGEIVAAATLSSKSTMPVGFIMIFGWPQMASWHPGQ